MEALATSAVVSSIVQLLSNGAKIYNLVDESLTKNATVEQITKDLLPLNDSLKRSLQYAGNPS
jgi:molecular chaperone GrpE (heat shock protein)